jgi:hypothetical protein
MARPTPNGLRFENWFLSDRACKAVGAPRHLSRRACNPGAPPDQMFTRPFALSTPRQASYNRSRLRLERSAMPSTIRFRRASLHSIIGFPCANDPSFQLLRAVSCESPVRSSSEVAANILNRMHERKMRETPTVPENQFVNLKIISRENLPVTAQAPSEFFVRQLEDNRVTQLFHGSTGSSQKGG